MTNEEIHNLFIEVVLKAEDNPVADHTHSISLTPPSYISHNHTLSSGMPVYYDRDVPRGTIYGMNNAIYANPNDINQILNQPTRAHMSTIDKIKQERREKREREELETKFQEWDEVFASERADVGFFTRDIGDKTYRYSCIYADKRWFLTGATTCGMTIEDFITWLINAEVLPENFVWLEAVE